MSPDYFDALQAELMAAVPRVAAQRQAPAGPAAGSLRPRMRAGALVPALAVAATVAVVVIAASLLGHGRHGAPRAPAGRPAPRLLVRAPVAQARSEAQLRTMFPALARRQTAADRSWRPPVIAGEPIVAGSQRLAGTLIDGARVFVIVRRPRGAAPGVRYAVSGYAVDRRGELVAALGDTPVSSLSPGGGYVAFGPTPVTDPADGATIWVSVVPRTVTRVRWTFGCPDRPRSICGAVRQVTFTVPSASGLATAWVRRAGGCPAVRCLFPSAVTWFGPHWTTYGYETSSPNGEVSEPILRGDGIGTARFGQPIVRAVSDVEARLGAPTTPGVSGGACGFGEPVQWSAPWFAAPLALYARNGRFVAYSYGQPTGHLGGNPAAPLRLTSDRGLALGDPVATARRLYGRRFTTSAEQGGTWGAGTAHGAMAGFVALNPRTAAIVRSADRIATIQAGARLCAGVSP